MPKAKKQSKTRKVLKWLNPTSPAKGMLLVAITFAVIGGSYMAFRSFAVTSTNATVGVNFHCMWSTYTDDQRFRLLDKLAAAKVGWVRLDMTWDGLEPSRGVHNSWYTQRADLCVNEATKRGLKVLAVVYQTPGWANSNVGGSKPPTSSIDFANFATWAGGYFKGRVAAWEIWNEPDPSQGFWTGTVAQYVDLLKAAYPKFKAADPSTKIVLGAPSFNDDTWIGQIYAAGAKNYFNVLATHPYQGTANQPPETPDGGTKYFFTHFPSVLNVMKQYNDGNKEVWFTEFGWSSHANSTSTPPWQLGVSDVDQANYLARAIIYARSYYPNVTNLFWYNERNRTDADIQNNNYGLLNSDLTEKYAYVALKNLLADVTPPVVNITSPASNSKLGSSLIVTATASDNAAVTKMEVYLDGQLQQTYPAATSLSWTTSTSALAIGIHTAKVNAYDPVGNVRTATITVIK